MLRAALIAIPLTLVACGAARTSAREPPGPKFDPSQSDPAALAAVDAGVVALAGADGQQRWEKVQQLSFTAKYTVDGTLMAWYEHHWDRWNGRHNFRGADLQAEVDEGQPPPWMEVFYDLYDDDAKPTAHYDGNELAHDDAVKFREQGRHHLDSDGYLLTIFYRLHEPTVTLKLEADAAPGYGVCEPSCKRVRVTFDPAHGRDRYIVNYNATTGRPEVIEVESKEGTIGYRLDEWTEVGGLSFPTQLQNVGFAGQLLDFTDVAIGSPDDALYVPAVTGD